ncbi:gamma-glutamyltransferase family protein [Candidatus Bipolaricaulota bacterium]|nr:gamma-glutamyltransferase family protein [Candidatus Bipolaricaulota bacterium]MBS3791703.1 gamma-glutamyltransferase family protein [Candidatus Bipolaricaulota bacterium]
MVATSQPLAAQAGLGALRKGGNAVDAAVATAASLTVLEPTSNGIGGDAFAQVWIGGELYGLNGSGPAPGDISADTLREEGLEEIPRFGWEPVTVPGAPAAWKELTRRFGELSLEESLEPAVNYAETGYPVQPTLGKYWRKAYEVFSELNGEEFESWAETFAPDGNPPETGDIWSSPDHAETLKSIASTGARAFYEGKLADRIDRFAKNTGGYIRKRDLAYYSPEWVDPMKVEYQDYEVWELPPNGQGLVALIALNILREINRGEGSKIEALHEEIEALKLAFVDGKKYITDPDYMGEEPDKFLTPQYARDRGEQIGSRAGEFHPGSPGEEGTVYLATADGDGNMVSFIQSNYAGFGSGIVVPGTGIALQNRGNLFTLDEGDYKKLEAGKRPYHTIIPGFLTRQGSAVGPFGVMGGYMQPQGHLQVLRGIIDRGLNPQAALDAPRWRWVEGKEMEVEKSFPDHIAGGLSRKGHEISIAADPGKFGRGQFIWKEGDTFFGATEPRTDGHVAPW